MMTPAEKAMIELLPQQFPFLDYNGDEVYCNDCGKSDGMNVLDFISRHSETCGQRRPLVHDGLMLYRINGDHRQARTERAFHETWKRENDGRQGSILETLLQSEEWHRERGLGFSFSSRSNEHYRPVYQWEATVAATVIQWLGTNVGFAFLGEALHAAGYVVVPVKPVEVESKAG